ncbi:MAG: hypothetical protein K6E10_00560 [Eubacterium sp.]|nr:hypothetical protein [Eubacterium sp.]
MANINDNIKLNIYQSEVKTKANDIKSSISNLVYLIEEERYKTGKYNFIVNITLNFLWIFIGLFLLIFTSSKTGLLGLLYFVPLSILLIVRIADDLISRRKINRINYFSNRLNILKERMIVDPSGTDLLKQKIHNNADVNLDIARPVSEEIGIIREGITDLSSDKNILTKMESILYFACLVMTNLYFSYYLLDKVYGMAEKFLGNYIDASTLNIIVIIVCVISIVLSVIAGVFFYADSNNNVSIFLILVNFLLVLVFPVLSFIVFGIMSLFVLIINILIGAIFMILAIWFLKNIDL